MGGAGKKVTEWEGVGRGKEVTEWECLVCLSVCPSVQTQLDGSQSRVGGSSDEPSSFSSGGFSSSQVRADRHLWLTACGRGHHAASLGHNCTETTTATLSVHFNSSHLVSCGTTLHTRVVGRAVCVPCVNTPSRVALCRVDGGSLLVNRSTGGSTIMDLVVVTVATALGVLIRGDEVVAGEGVGGAALTGPSTRRGGVPTKSSRAAGRSPEVGGGDRTVTSQRACDSGCMHAVTRVESSTS